MLGTFVRKIFGSKNDREVKRMLKAVDAINRQESSLESLSDEALAAKRDEFRERIASGETLNQVLPDAFAVCREVSKRTLGLRHFDVQMVGGMTLHEGRISEMRTGEGKTLVATLPAYLNAIEGKGVHVVTVNEYLASRDANWMRPLYEGLGLTVGVIASGQSPEDKRAAYAADITYGTNNEFGFDYLRDNMAFSPEGRVQRALSFAIVDEVDSILIDEARTPLIISGPADDHSERYKAINGIIPKLTEAKMAEDGESFEVEGHYLLDEKNRSVELTELGHEFIEAELADMELLDVGDSLYNPANLALFHHVNAGLRAYTLFQRNVHYIIQDGQIVIVDEHTGRTMPGRRWSEGLHQAVEAKEGLEIQPESQTLASTTFQNYFRLYDRLSGMTGTADTEAYEFRQIYGLDVVVIPTNVPVKRIDHNDLVYMTMEEKFEAIVADVIAERDRGRPVLVGTASVEASEVLSQFLEKEGIQHNVLNAKQHEREAPIIAEAGRPGAITIATNMAGRGTDIMLGGNWQAEVAELDAPTDTQIESIKTDWQARHDAVLEAGGLHIIGSERHESRRIDNQLRGRSGRQGDPGSSRFFLSLEDDLMRIFASPRMRSIMQGLGMQRGEAIEHKMVTNAIEKAQKKVEGRNFDMRKQLLDYDDVANDQRTQVYAQRNELMDAEDLSDLVDAVRRDVFTSVVASYIPPQSLIEQWDIPGLTEEFAAQFGLEMPIQAWLDEDESLYEETLLEKIIAEATRRHDEKVGVVGEETMRRFEKQVLLQVLDHQWKEHLAAMDYLRQGIHLRGYAQKNPKQEYKREAFELFTSMLDQIKRESVRVLTAVQVPSKEEIEAQEEARRQQAVEQLAKAQATHDETTAVADSSDQEMSDRPMPAVSHKVGRNEPCPCGSGKKYKQCHGRIG
ncbi:MAG: preprotein translocase subunit SecA [Litoricola sp.]|jgi:preprotein translocase subunit SecA|nr:preprotein translocase subunit SecA [Litorivicinus sp.]MBL6810061.1 preprotein translocase subunit SecA [Litorivicinus sp.]MBT6287847.1 preprotein translocase subunit SecA [Oceanospirillales bacterium]HAB78584.1 preprotein translocase subunit SecA [Gammaproteobacteria bacterium]HBZ91838.1 preprotein translocase subunit SecA [Gammaproteobacteria bacterium]